MNEMLFKNLRSIYSTTFSYLTLQQKITQNSFYITKLIDVLKKRQTKSGGSDYTRIWQYL